MTLPGMPLAACDLFICGPGDIQPEPRRAVRTARPSLAVVRPAPRWLVLTGCLTCNDRTGIYCREHRADNWWLTVWGGQKKTRPARPLDAGT